MRQLGLAALAVALLACWQADETAHPVTRAPDVAIASGAAERLAGAVRIPTISHADSAAFDAGAFSALHEYLKQQFPRVHAELQRDTVATHSLLYTWRGSDPSLKPILLMAHQDVVPVEPGTEAQWEQPPFAGTIADGFVWGRGAIDNKSAVVGILEAVEMLLAEGYRPQRTVLLAFGHDEEIGGIRGARAIADVLAQRATQIELVLDEGGVVGDGVMPGLPAPTALVGVAEKGFVSLELIARAEGGHSSLPPRQSAIGILSAAIARVEENQMPARIHGATQQLFEAIAPHAPGAQRAIFSNLWLTRPLVVRKLQANPTTNAMVRTTTAVTIFQGGTKENVLPRQARAIINFRILPGDSIADVVAHVRRVVDDPRVEVGIAPGFSAEPSAISRTDSKSYRTVARTVRSLAPDMIVAPYLVVVVTDARYFAGLTETVLRFLPVRLQPADLARMHGLNERLAIRDYEWAIRFYRQLIINATSEMSS
jgi:carboxypeptidase PM20D1